MEKRTINMFGRRPGRAPDLRSARDCLSGSWLVSALFVLVSLTTNISASSIECCPDGTQWNNPSTNCSDGSKIRLNCPNGYFSLDPAANHFDEFSIVDRDGPRLEFLHDYDSIPSSKFCVSGKNEKERWALICFDDEEYTAPSWRYVVFGVLSIISTIFLVLTLAVYSVLPELRDIQDKAMASAIAFLATSYFLLAIEQMRFHPSNDDIICIPLESLLAFAANLSIVHVQAFLLYWTFLSAFFWIHLVAFNVWRTVWFKQFPIKDKELFVVFCGVGFIGPGVFLIAALATHHTEGYHLKPRFGENACWFGGNSETWAFFYGPISCLLALNVIYLGLTCWRLWVEYRGYTGSGLRALRFNCLLYVKLILVMGITWIFEVISFAASPGSTALYWFATDILNGLQGFVIFLLLVMMRKRVKKLLARRQPLGINFPKSWAAYDDDDEETPALPVEMELSNSP